MRDYFPDSDVDGGWRTCAPGDVGMESLALDAAFEYIQGSTKNGGLAVVKDGWLVYERYFGKGHREAAPNQGSCGKSFTSIAMGILLDEMPERFPDGLDQKVFTPDYLPPEAFPLTDPRKAEIKLGQLLTMAAGIRGNNPGCVNGEDVMLDPVGPDGWYGMTDHYALGLRDGDMNGVPFTTKSLWCEPGGGYSYATASIHIVSTILRHVTGMELQDYVAEKLAKPLGWGHWSFAYRNAREVNHTPGGGGIAIRATDMLRFLYMLLNNGRWGDQQVVPEWYVQHCANPSPYNPHYPYSLQFTLCHSSSGVPKDTYWKAGSGGHGLFVVPSLNMVIWKLGGRDEQFSEANTGLPVLPEVAEAEEPRRGWEQSVDDSTAWHKTLEMVASAVK